jgi:hypothetical protein
MPKQGNILSLGGNMAERRDYLKAKRDAKVRQIHEEQEKREQEHCTFRPKTTSNTGRGAAEPNRTHFENHKLAKKKM